MQKSSNSNGRAGGIVLGTFDSTPPTDNGTLEKKDLLSSQTGNTIPRPGPPSPAPFSSISPEPSPMPVRRGVTIENPYHIDTSHGNGKVGGNHEPPIYENLEESIVFGDDIEEDGNIYENIGNSHTSRAMEDSKPKLSNEQRAEPLYSNI